MYISPFFIVFTKMYEMLVTWKVMGSNPYYFFTYYYWRKSETKPDSIPVFKFRSCKVQSHTMLLKGVWFNSDLLTCTHKKDILISFLLFFFCMNSKLKTKCLLNCSYSNPEWYMLIWLNQENKVNSEPTMFPDWWN